MNRAGRAKQEPATLATRLVVMPEWQGAGLGTRFLDAICQWHLEGNGRGGHKFPTIFHTSHPQLAAALRRNPLWVQKSLKLFGGKCNTKTMGEALSRLKGGPVKPGTQGKYGGHLRAVQGFGYFGEGANG